MHENHLGRVVETLRQFGETNETRLAAAWLHDTVEDTSVTVEDVRREFGDDVADLVWRLKQRSNLYGMYRKEHVHFRAELYREDECEEMWQRLDSLPGRG